MTSRRLVAGALIHVAVLGVLGMLGVRAAAGAADIGARLVSALDAERSSDLVVQVQTTEGLQAGLPAYVLDEHGGGRVVGHVLSWSDADRRARIRFAPGEGGIYAAEVFPPRRGLRDAYALAVPEATAQEIVESVRARGVRLWDETLEADVNARLPAFFARIDPRGTNTTRQTLDALGGEVLERMRPHVDDLVGAVTKAVDRQLDVWDRVGVLWDMVRGDEKKLEKKLRPVAEKAARRWWDRNRDGVLASLGEAVEARMPELGAWVETEGIAAAREELLLPLIEAHGDRLEQEGEAVVRLLLDRVVRLPDDGGFQVRFAAMLRHVLFGKRTALLVLVPEDAAR